MFPVSGVPLKCDCALLWLWELTERRNVVDGATCDNTALEEVDVDSLACDHREWGIIIACVGSSIIVIILIVIIAAIVKCCKDKRSAGKYIHCDYLQYNTNVMKQADDLLITTYMQPSPSHQIYAEIDKYSPYMDHSGSPNQPKHPRYPVMVPPEQIYYSVQDPLGQGSGSGHGPMIHLDHNVYSSSGSASSDQNTSSTECSIPLR